jgi:ComF family protein
MAFDSVVVFGSYAEGLRHTVLLMKRGAREPLSLAIGRWLAARLESDLRQRSIDFIVPVPMFWRRRLWRGTNNPDLLAEALSDRLGVPFDPRCLVRVRSTPQQNMVPPSERHANVRGAFRLRGGRDVTDKTLLVVDDVLTTGATCNETAKVLKEAGAKAVHVCVVARAKSAR